MTYTHRENRKVDLCIALLTSPSKRVHYINKREVSKGSIVSNEWRPGFAAAADPLYHPVYPLFLTKSIFHFLFFKEAHVQKFDSFAYCAPRLEFLLLSSCNFVSRFLILRVLRISNRFPILVLCLPNSRFFLLMQDVKKQYSVGLAKGAKLVFQIECQLARHCLVSSQVMRVSFVALNCRVRRK